MKGTFVDFRRLKQGVSVVTVLAHYGVRLRPIGNSFLRGPCPLPTHTSERSKDSFSVNILKDVWACHSASCVNARDGKVGGDVLDFVALMDGCSVREAALRLQSEFVNSAEQYQRAQERSTRSGESKPVNPSLQFTLAPIDSGHPYLQGRGISLETAKHFGVGYYPGKGSMSGRIVFPIHDHAGTLVAYAGRSIDETGPRYRFPKGFVKSLVLFNLHRVSSTEVILVEGFFDCMKVWQAGHQNVVALMGSLLSAQQERLLFRFGRIILFLDGDDAGMQASREIASRLLRSRCVRVVEIAAGWQPDELPSKRIRGLLQFYAGL